MRTAVGKGLMVSCLVCMLLAPALAVSKTTFSGIVVFGTSLSDPGNDFALRGIANVPPYDRLDPFLIPDDPYATGGNHVSNGATWVEHLGRSLGLAGSVRPAFRSSAVQATNYAVKGARAIENGVNVNLVAQVAAFLSDNGGVAPHDSLYAIEIGANDVRDAMQVFAAGGDGGAVLTEALTAVAGAVQTLYTAGARDFLVWKIPDIGLTPALNIMEGFSPGASAAASSVTQAYNAGVESVLTMLEGLPGISLRRLDAFRLLNDIVSDPAAYGISVVNKACVTPNYAPFSCQNPDEYLFWDGIHPTTTVHAIIGQEAGFVLAR